MRNKIKTLLQTKLSKEDFDSAHEKIGMVRRQFTRAVNYPDQWKADHVAPLAELLEMEVTDLLSVIREAVDDLKTV